MKRVKIVYIKIEAEDYDPRFCCNGGSYYQPTIKILFNDKTSFCIEDTSCGDFGSRIYVEAYIGGTKKEAYYGTMLEENEDYSSFSNEDLYYLEKIFHETGYGIPYWD